MTTIQSAFIDRKPTAGPLGLRVERVTPNGPLSGGSLTRAAFLSARNDALANVAIVGAGLVTLAIPSVWPDVIVGLGIACMNVDAAKEVWSAARSEHRAATRV